MRPARAPRAIIRVAAMGSPFRIAPRASYAVGGSITEFITRSRGRRRPVTARRSDPRGRVARSEERRVGKECRGRWWAAKYEKNRSMGGERRGIVVERDRRET